MLVNVEHGSKYRAYLPIPGAMMTEGAVREYAETTGFAVESVSLEAARVVVVVVRTGPSTSAELPEGTRIRRLV